MDKTRGFEVAKGFEEQSINLPKRQTKNSAGYDFESAIDVTVPSIWRTVLKNIGKFFAGDDKYDPIVPVVISTGIKSYMQDDEALFMYNRSGNPLKKGLILGNSVGVVDSDYYSNESNDGHIMFQFYNFFPFDTNIKKGERIGQGIFQKYLKADSDNAEGTRVGGHGSTND